MTCNTFDAPSTKYSALALTAEQLNAQIQTFDTLLAREADPALRYTESVLVSAVSNVTAIVNSIKTNPVYTTRYTTLIERVAAGPITISEYADFISKAGYTEEQVVLFQPSVLLPITTEIYLDNLNTYYTQNFGSSISGGFCSLFTGILGKLSSLFAAYQSVTNLADMIKNFDPTKLVSNALAQLNSIKQLLHGLVDSIKDKMLKTLDSIKNTVSGFTAMAKQFGEKLKKVANFFSDINIQKIKDKIESIIGGIAAKFTAITPEILNFLLFRFCQLTNVLELFMKAPLSALQDDVLKFQQAESILKNMSSSAKLTAVVAGAFRMDDNTINGLKDRMANVLNQKASIPSDVAAGAGTASGSTAKPQRYYTKSFTAEEIAMANAIKTASVSDLRSGNYSAQPYLNFAGAIDDEPDGEGVKKLSIDILIIAIRISKRIGKQLYVNCGYRSPKTNAALYAKDPKNVAKNSLHMSCLAMDISMTRSGLDSVAGRERFIQIASQEGAGGIGTYNTFIHIDTGNRRKWTSASNTSYKHSDTLNLHAADKFRNGVPEAPPIAFASTSRIL